MAPFNPDALSILVIEDDPSAARGLEVFLHGSRGHTLVFASNGDEALEAIRAAKRAFDLIICDSQLDDETGLEIIVRIRSWCAENRRPMPNVLGMPSETMPATVGHWHHAGVTTLVRKPWDAITLLKAITSMSTRQ